MHNDANRACCWCITGIVMAVLLVAIAAEAVGHNPQPVTKVLIIVTLVLAWLFSNTIYALHYAHLVYMQARRRLRRARVPRHQRSRIYWDFVYFAFTLRDGVRRPPT